MKLNKTFLTLGLAATLLQMPASSFAQTAGGNRQNPLLTKSSLPFGAPDFSTDSVNALRFPDQQADALLHQIKEMLHDFLIPSTGRQLTDNAHCLARIIPYFSMPA